VRLEGVLARRAVLAMKRGVFIGFFVAFALVHAIVAAWTPVQGDAWLHWVWAGRHPDSGVGTWLLAHLSSADAFGYILAKCNSVHVIVSPMIAIALVIGLFVVAVGRTPRASGEDLLGLALTSALIWIAQPHAGVTWFYTPSVAMHVYGAAAAVWLIAAIRCEWERSWPALIVLAYVAGTSTRAIALVTLVIVIWMTRGRRWRLVSGALLVATVIGFVRSPYLEVGKVFRRGLDPNLFVLRLPIEEIGKVVALVAVFVLVELGRRTAGRTPLTGEPEQRVTVRLVVGYLAASVFCVFGPKYYESTLFPATLLLVVAALPWLMWFASARGYRIALIAFVVGVHAIAWTLSLVMYHRIGAEGAMRQRILEHTQPGDVAIVQPYSEILSNNFFFGEDLSTTRLRQLVAIDVFGLRDIALSPQFRRLEANPQIAVALEQDNATVAELAAARVPAIWSTVPSVAREQFDLFVHRLARASARPVAARLVVKNLQFPRPILAAWVDAKEAVIPRVALSTLDEENQFTAKMYNELARFDEAWVVHDGTATKTPYRNGSPRMRPTTPTLQAIVVCNAKVCLLEDAFVPRF
jgi:hypothetical protein